MTLPNSGLTYADKMACLLCLLCLSVLRPKLGRRVNTASLRPVYEELLKFCHETCVCSEVLTQTDAFLFRPVPKKLVRGKNRSGRTNFGRLDLIRPNQFLQPKNWP